MSKPAEEAAPAAMGSSLHRSSHSAGMEASVFRFKNLNFTVPSKKKDEEEKHILQDVNATVKWGRKYLARVLMDRCSRYQSVLSIERCSLMLRLQMCSL